MAKIELPENKLSKKLLEDRVGKNITQMEIAEDIGVSYPVYLGIEKGTYKMSLKILIKIANYLGIETSEALDLYESK